MPDKRDVPRFTVAPKDGGAETDAAALLIVPKKIAKPAKTENTSDAEDTRNPARVA
jgi:hypothetical protein